MPKLLLLSEVHIPLLMEWALELNKVDSYEVQRARLEKMFTYPTYRCFGFFDKEELLGYSGSWTTERLYSGKQLELDHVLINPALRSKGYGGQFLEALQQWALNHDYQTIELNSYLENRRSHDFYKNLGFRKLGFHFQKKIQ